MKQIPVRGMQFDNLESRVQGPSSRIAKGVDGGANLYQRKFLRNLVSIGELDGAGGRRWVTIHPARD